MSPRTIWDRITEEDDEPKPKPKKPMALVHDDSCGEFLTPEGLCPKCKFYPDMQSTAFREIP
jgi:hypothetical protein